MVAKNRITQRYCPKCESPVILYGAIKHQMVICLNDDCREYTRIEDTLELKDTLIGEKLAYDSYIEGYEKSTETFLKEIE